MEDARYGKPVVGQPLHSFRSEAIFLAAPPKHAEPVVDHIVAESAESQAVRRNGVIGKVAPNDLFFLGSFRKRARRAFSTSSI